MKSPQEKPGGVRTIKKREPGRTQAPLQSGREKTEDKRNSNECMRKIRAHPTDVEDYFSVPRDLKTETTFPFQSCGAAKRTISCS